MPQFSVIVPFRDAETTLPEALSSLASQTDADWEALLINDASTDGSVALVANATERDPRLRLIDDKSQCGLPRGVAASRNLGIAAARGKYVALLDADDRWLPKKLELQRQAFEDGADIVFSAYRRINMNGQLLSIVPACPIVAWNDALGGNPIGCLTGAWRRELFPEALMPDRDMHEDYAFWLSLLRSGAVAHGLPQVLAEYRVRSGSTSSNKWRAAQAVWSILGDENLRWHRRSFGFLRYACNAIVRRI